MKTRAGLQFQVDGPIEVVEMDIPDDPKPNQVLVKMFSSGICHSHLHTMHNPNAARPVALGHEGTGVVSKVGSGVNHLNEGDVVIVTWVRRSMPKGPIPPAKNGATYQEQEVTDSVYTQAEDVLMDADYVVPIGKDDPTDVSCIVGCAVLTGAGAVINTAKVKEGETVAVFGVGGVGLCAVQAAAISGANPVIAVDLDDAKLELAKEFGASHVINAAKTNPVEAIVDLTHGGVDYAFDAIGVKATNEQILPSTRPGGSGADNLGGTAVLIGLPHENHEMSIPPRLFVGGQRQYRGSLGATYPDTDFPMFLQWHKEGKFPLDKLITRRYPLDEIDDAYKALQAGEVLGRSILLY